MVRTDHTPHDAVNPATQSVGAFERVESGMEHDEHFLHDVVSCGGADAETPGTRPNEIEVVAINGGKILHEGWSVRGDRAAAGIWLRGNQVVSAHLFFTNGSAAREPRPSRNPPATERYRNVAAFSVKIAIRSPVLHPVPPDPPEKSPLLRRSRTAAWRSQLGR